MNFIAIVRSERATVAGMRAALDGRLTALDLVIASYESMPTSRHEVEVDVHDHPQMFDARVPVASPAPVRTETASLGHSSATGSAGEEIPDHPESGSPAETSPQPAPMQVAASTASPAPLPAVESAAGTITETGSPRSEVHLGAPPQKVGGSTPAKPAVVERAAGTISKPTNKAFGNGLATAHEEAPKPKPVAASLPTARDPLLAREPEYFSGTKALAAEDHHGSASQQLADRILADMPALMKDHPRGPIRADLAVRYGVKPARVQDAVIYLFAGKKIRLERFDGTEQHIVPPDFELVPVVRPAPASPKDAAPAIVPMMSRNEDAVFSVLREAVGANGLTALSQRDISRRASVPAGSLPFAIGSLVQKGRIKVERAPTSTSPAVYRVLSATAGA